MLVKANGKDLWVETFGDASGTPLLLITGAGSQCLLWPDEFCKTLSRFGYYLIRYDHRDTGKSCEINYAQEPYNVTDLARDAVGVLSSLKMNSAHVVGFSMGGQIAQFMAAYFPQYVKTITLLGTSTSFQEGFDAFEGKVTIDGLSAPKDHYVKWATRSVEIESQTKEERISDFMMSWRLLNGNKIQQDEELYRQIAEACDARSNLYNSFQNHGSAMQASYEEHRMALRLIKSPTLILHGTEDPVFGIDHAYKLNDSIPNANLEIVSGMGHSLHPYFYNELINTISNHVDSYQEEKGMSLETHKLSRVNVSFTGLALGGAQIGNHPVAMKREDAVNLIIAAWKNGVRVFDTAPLYGYGLSETIYGEVLKLFPREQFIISTKVGCLLFPDDRPKGEDDLFPNSLPNKVVYDYTYDGIMKSVKESLDRLQTEYLDIVHIHDLDTYTHKEKQPEMMQSFLRKNAAGKTGYDALIELRNSGIIRAIGVGSNNWECCLEVMDNTPENFLDVIELSNRYTLFEQPALAKLFPACEKRGIKLMIAGPLNSGILSGNSDNKYYNYKPADAAVLARRDDIANVCANHNVLLRVAALQFLKINPLVVTIVSGMRTEQEVIQNIESMQPMRLEKLWKELKERKLLDEKAFTGYAAKVTSMFQSDAIAPIKADIATVKKLHISSLTS